MTDKSREAFDAWMALQKVPDHLSDSAVADTLKIAEIAFGYARKQAIEECIDLAKTESLSCMPAYGAINYVADKFKELL